VRVTGGMARGVPIKKPGNATRPATDRMRQAVFSCLERSTREGLRFLDLFAGTGAYGLEALSRGAGSGVFVEKDRKAVNGIKLNLVQVARSIGLAGSPCRVCAADVFRWKSLKKTDSFDLLFIDPPYSLIDGRVDDLFALADENLSNNLDARLVFEMPGELHLEPMGWKVLRRLGKDKSGEPAVVIYSRAG